MCQFIETIRIENGVIHNLEYHNQRFNSTRRHFFPHAIDLDLGTSIKVPSEGGRIKCRILYNEEIREITYTPYTLRHIHSLQMIHCNSLNYRYKSSSRNELNALFAQRNSCDDVLIVKNGMLTDTSIANIAVSNGSQWFTPAKPLLEGTQRAFLINKGIVIPKDIIVEEVFCYKKIVLFNALIPFGELIIPITPQTIVRSSENNKLSE